MRSKKLISILLLLCLCSGLLMSACAAGTELTVEAPKTLPAVGKSFTLTVSLSGNPGLGAVQFTLGFDKSVLECTKMSAGSILDDTLAATNPKAVDGARLGAATSESISGNGVLASCTFKVLKDGDPAFALKDVVLTKPDKTAVHFTVNYKGAAGQTPSSPNPGEPTTRPQGFSDVPDNHWAAEYIERAVNAGLIIGNTDGTFNPEGSVTRAQFVTMLWRMAGRPTSAKQTPFKDVDKLNNEFKSAISWAYEKGYISGKSTTQFGPNDTITRQQAMTILFRYSGEVSGMEAMLTEIYDSQYTDSASISSYAKRGVYWAVYNGIVTGVTKTTLVPHGTATRAQTTVILTRYMDKFQNQ